MDLEPEPGATVREDDLELVGLLGQRYGAGSIYLRGGYDRVLLARAIERGLVSEEGYLTATGYRLWRRRAARQPETSGAIVTSGTGA
jgi:hypothetical protein